MIDQRVAFDGVALIKNVFVDRPWRSMKLSWFSDWWFDPSHDCAFSGGEL
jgi:hypothetical protein